jgi:hypothetical protein
MLTTPVGPKFVKNTDQSGAKSGDHTQESIVTRSLASTSLPSAPSARTIEA